MGSQSPKPVLCKYCSSPNVVKFGTYHGSQRYWCKVCERKFTLTDALPKMKTPADQIITALSCYYGGMSLDAIQAHLKLTHNAYYSEPGIYKWVIRFSKEAADRAKAFRPIIGDTWIADETMLKVGGRNLWFFDIIDADSRYLLASRLTNLRTIVDVEAAMNEARTVAGKDPKRILTDRMTAYPEGIERVFGSETTHVQSKPFVDVDSTNLIERFHGTLKGRTKVVKGFKNMEAARILTGGWLVYYNFFKEHESLGNIAPARKMGRPVPFEDWEDVVRGEKPTAVVELESESPSAKPVKFRVAKPAKKKSQRRRRKPTNLKSRAYAQISVVRG